MIELKNITKAYQMGDQVIRALDDVSLAINDGEYVAIIGPSGSGKSTLMNVLGCLDNPSAGQYVLNGKDVSRLRDDQLAGARNKNIGFVFQRFNLMGRMSALRNVEMPARYSGANGRVRRQRATEALTAVGLGDRINHTPVELSGGQQQRVAIARALVNQPNILLADEPTGALDSKTGKDILDLFERLHGERGITLIVVTHDPTVARRADRVISIRDGRIESDIGTAHASTPSANGQAAGAATMVAELVTAGDALAEAIAIHQDTHAAERPIGTNETSGVTHAKQEKVAAAAPANANKTAGRLPTGKLWRRGLIAVAIAAVVNVVLGLLIGTVLPFASRLPMFSPVPIALFTIVVGLLGVGVFALINRVASKPIAVFRWVAVGALVLSFVPNVVMISNPTMLRQVVAQGAGAGPGGFTGAPGQGPFSGAGQRDVQGANASSQQVGGQGQSGQRGNRVPGLGPLGGILGGNNANAAGQRGGGAGVLTIPMVALMLLHVAAFGIIVGGLTRETTPTQPPPTGTFRPLDFAGLQSS